MPIKRQIYIDRLTSPASAIPGLAHAALQKLRDGYICPLQRIHRSPSQNDFDSMRMTVKNMKRKRRRRLKPLLLMGAACALLSARSASAQEIALYGGWLRGAGTNTYSWAIDYTEGFGRYLAGSITWLNEGHMPDHHRDGQAVQIWGRLPLAQNRFVIAVGVGPYRYFDTEAAEQGQGYSNTHGWGGLFSARATWYTSRRWTTSLQLNRVQVSNGPSTTAVLLGAGYQLDAPDEPERVVEPWARHGMDREDHIHHRHDVRVHTADRSSRGSPRAGARAPPGVHERRTGSRRAGRPRA